MNRNVQAQIELLEQSQRLATDEETDSFTAAASWLAEHRPLEVIDRMLRCFHDVEAGEVQYELIEACEAFATQVYVAAVVRTALDVHRQAPTWFRLMLQSILNSDEHRDALVEAFSKSDKPTGEFLAGFVQELADRSPKYREVASQLGAIRQVRSQD